VNFVGAAELAAMKRSAVFISIGRGSCVDEDALAEALHAGTIAGRCADGGLLHR
jgi:phosphoglycerate dehydrogenase-like enzyme